MDLISRFDATDPSLQLTLRVVRWACMTGVLFWVVVYHLSTDAAGLPQFVYVNF